MWQELIVIVCVITAALFVLRAYWPGMRKKNGGCAGCDSGCGKTNKSACQSNNIPPSPKV